MPSIFQPVARPDPVVIDTTLDTELGKAVDDANLTLYFINMVVISASDLVNKDGVIVDKSDPYCEVRVGEISDKTNIIRNDLNPVWNEKMSFFVPKKPDFITFHVFDDDSNRAIATKDDSCGVAKLEISDLFTNQSSFEGELELEDVKSGKISIKVKCRVLKPIETEVKLGFVEMQLEGKGKEQKATVVALDESEKLREEAIHELCEQEQEVIRQAEELEEKQTELTTKEKNILNQAQEIEVKIQQYEEAEVKLRKAEIKKKDAETKLTKAEEKILDKAQELELKEKENADALTTKEKEIIAAAGKLEEKERAHEITQMEMKKIEALRVEVANELTSKEKIILQQAENLKKRENEHSEVLTTAEKKLFEKSRELEARDVAAKAAQKRQDENQSDLDHLKQDLQQKQNEIDASNKANNAEIDSLKRTNDAEIDSLKRANDNVEAELKRTKDELQMLQEEIKTHADPMICSGCTIS